MSVPQRGRIVWVELLDPQGRNPKNRPAVIVSDNAHIHPGDPTCEVLVVGITTKVEETPAEHAVALPWQRGRHPRTGLYEPSVAVITWLERIRLAAIREYGGTVPGRQLLDILQRLEALTTTPPPTSQEPPNTSGNSDTVQ